MWKFITVTFAFLGFAFFELSGGTDFDPEELRLSRVDAAPADPIATTGQEPAALDTVRVAAAAPASVPAATTVSVANIAPVASDSGTVTRASFAPSSSDLTEPAARVSATFDTAATAQPEQEQILILPSLIGQTAPAADAGETQQAEDASPVVAADIRAVSGNRVNVRGGPGTKYSIVNRLTRGQEVEILQDPGNGWVKLRPVDGGSVGWMADFLLTSG